MLLKNWFAAAIAACAVFAAGTHAAGALTLEQIQAKGVMTVATEDDFRPFEFIQDGKPAGLDNALLDQLRKHAGFRIEQNIIPWSGLLPGVTTGKYDVALTSVVVTPERAKTLDFTMPVADATQYYVVRNGETRIKSVADLAGKVVGVQAGGGSYAALADLSKTLAAHGGQLGKVVQYASFPEAYQDLSNGRLDYVINGVVNLTSLVHEHPDRFRIGTAVGAPTYAAWAVAKGNTTLLRYLNDFLAKTRADGSLYALQRKWLGTTFESMPLSALSGN